MRKQKRCPGFKGHRRILLLFIALLVLLAGCTLRRIHSGSKFPENLETILTVGMTKGQVLEVLGPPDAMGLRLQGTIFIYRYSNQADEDLKLSAFQGSFNYGSSDLRTARLVVFFDKKGRVTAFGRN